MPTCDVIVVVFVVLSSIVIVVFVVVGVLCFFSHGCIFRFGDAIGILLCV